VAIVGMLLLMLQNAVPGAFPTAGIGLKNHQEDIQSFVLISKQDFRNFSLGAKIKKRITG
jgi:hypothetical protein